MSRLKSISSSAESTVTTASSGTIRSMITMDTPGTIVLFQVKYESKNWPASPVIRRTLIQLTGFSIFLSADATPR